MTGHTNNGRRASQTDRCGHCSQGAPPRGAHCATAPLQASFSFLVHPANIYSAPGTPLTRVCHPCRGHGWHPEGVKTRRPAQRNPHLSLLSPSPQSPVSEVCTQCLLIKHSFIPPRMRVIRDQAHRCPLVRLPGNLTICMKELSVFIDRTKLASHNAPLYSTSTGLPWGPFRATCRTCAPGWPYPYSSRHASR